MDNIGQNSWVLEPKEEEKFYPSRVKAIIKEQFEERLKTETYDQNTTPNLAEELVKIIRGKIRDTLKMPRYKLAVQVVIGEIKGQGCKITSKSLWDSNFDNYASFSFTNETIYAVGIVFGVYYE